MSDIIQLGSEYYILATSSLADDRTWVLKDGDTFAVLDRNGDIHPLGSGEQGLYHEGTRFLSRLEVRLGTDRPLLLSSTVKEGNELLAVDFTNPDVYQKENLILSRHTYHVFRSKFLRNGTCYERFRVRNHSMGPLRVVLRLNFEADFADIFEVRGVRRKRKGQIFEPTVEDTRVTLNYRGVDGVMRKTLLHFSPRPKTLSDSEASWEAQLDPQEALTFNITVRCQSGSSKLSTESYPEAIVEATKNLKKMRSRSCSIYTTNEQFNDWVNRSMADLYVMLTEKETGPYPYAGIPWFCTPFGRDGILTALECLWVDPEIAKGVLSFLAYTQADTLNSDQDAEPGKILHETRKGELAATKEIPFGLYYGSIDATPLFVMLAGAYYERTDDVPFIERLWPSIEKALKWMDTFGDKDGDGFLEYERSKPKGLRNQGWKDSEDAVFHADGSLAEGPIALCEVQGYAYAARLAAATVATRLGKHEVAEKLSGQAKKLQKQFEQAFWCDDIGTYAIALDGEKRPCKVRSSNAGQCLFSGIAAPERAKKVAKLIMTDDFFTGWGIRTVAATESRYNPLSYHNGSVWPHDCAFIAHGMRQYGMREEAQKILTGLFDASIFVNLHRLPELFCGFTRRPSEGPTLYPVACSPQTWATASVFLLLQTCLGLSFDAPKKQISFSYPILPPSIQEISVKNLTVAGSSMDLNFVRHETDVGVNVLRKEGEVETVITK